MIFWRRADWSSGGEDDDRDIGCDRDIGAAMASMSWRWRLGVMVALILLVASAAQAQQLPDTNCSAMASLAQPSAVPARDPCGNTTAYSELGACARFMAGNTSTPSQDCCTSAHNIWDAYPACFCKVTYFSKFPGNGPALARARPSLCNITDDLCSLCPSSLSPYQSDAPSSTKKKMPIVSIVATSVIATLAIVGCVWLFCFCKKKQPWKPKQSSSKNYIPQFNNV